jgi:LysM repeat protein
MRKFISLISLAAILSACARTPTPTAAPPASTPDARSAAVSEIVNVVEARAAEAEAFAPVSLGYTLQAGGGVRTGVASKARLDFNDGSIVRLAESSTFVMLAAAATDLGLIARLQLEAGKLWVSLMGGTLEVETPVGVAAVRGSFAVIHYRPGDPGDPDDDLLVLDCLEGSCAAQNENVDASLGNLERVVLNRVASLRLPLTSADVEAFLIENPESQGLSPTLTAAPPATDTPAPTATDTAVPSPTFTATFLPTATFPPTETPFLTATPIVGVPLPSAAILGQHIVRQGETLFCIGRGYGVLPDAIAQVNGLTAPYTLTLNQVLRIPAVQWTNVAPGPVCAPQFTSPFPAPSASTATPAASATTTLTPTPTCPLGEFFDPFQQRCRPPASPVPAATATATTTPLPPPTATFTPIPTFTPTLTPTSTPTDTVGPGISLLSVYPPSAGVSTPYYTCTVTFYADITDPSGVSSASVIWIASDLASTPFITQTLPMSPYSGTTWSANLNVDMTLAPSSPYYGTINWSVQAYDTFANLNNVSSVTPLDVPTPQGGCP